MLWNQQLTWATKTHYKDNVKKTDERIDHVFGECYIERVWEKARQRS